ncbi:hypothetical protein IFU08_00930 [Microbacterium sp. CFBP 8790]|uniref:hypothetical protein n=1 Tax=unclassified Microbacterium TaxID=2609290 RepID=UPI00177B5623|nr:MULTISPECIES: hypothetical protein [unclassified Microbacterium]MBD8205540.1 hypothetical protein [Microbacterium sp. CFBP 8801]MBD8508125.1 hypothetical protein [Microbacterium sp. CFBP 8790]
MWEDDEIRTGSEDVFAWDGEMIEQEAIPLALSIRTDVARAIDEYELILTRTLSPAYAAMVSARAAGLITFEVLEHGEWPVAVVTTVAERLQAFIVGSKARLQFHLDRRPDTA